MNAHAQAGSANAARAEAAIRVDLAACYRWWRSMAGTT